MSVIERPCPSESGGREAEGRSGAWVINIGSPPVCAHMHSTHTNGKNWAAVKLIRRVLALHLYVQGLEFHPQYSNKVVKQSNSLLFIAFSCNVTYQNQNHIYLLDA